MSVGKRILDDLYVHIDAAERRLDGAHWDSVSAAREQLHGQAHTPNVVKLNLRTGRFSLLAYPDFEIAPFPELAASWTMSEAGEFSYRTYQDSLNPPILHRKELLVPEDWPQRTQWVDLTKTAESIGLFDETRAIGFRLNWERLIASKGYRLVGQALLPQGNEDNEGPPSDGTTTSPGIQRHLTAMVRNSLSAPVQLLIRSGLLAPGISFFDYGCGRGGDMAGLSEDGYEVGGWDPHYAPANPQFTADVVNLGFVVNVIEDPGERVEAITKAAALARGVLAVSVMLYTNEVAGKPYGDGFRTSRSTFQKYFSQGEFKDFLEHVLSLPVLMAGPGIALVFTDRDWEQRYLSGKYRRRNVAHRLLDLDASGRRRTSLPRERLLRPPRPPRPSKEQLLLEESRPILDQLWKLALDLGRWPEPPEVPNLAEVEVVAGSLARARGMLAKNYDGSLLSAAAKDRRDDVLVFLAAQQFSRRPPYRSLEPRLQRDIKTFFGDYTAAQAAAVRLLLDTADPAKLLAAAKDAAQRGLGWLEAEHSLQLHISLVDRLPALLRVYVACGLVLWDATSEVQLVKIHIDSGKLTLMELDDFDQAPLPLLRRRVKVNLRKLDCDLFEYGTAAHPAPLLYRKGRYLNEDCPGYGEQLAFDEALEQTGVLGISEYGPSPQELVELLEFRRLQVRNGKLVESDRIPDLDQPCGSHFTFRNFVECGETQVRTAIKNVPLNPATYNALHNLAEKVLDPVIDYFGGIRLTYGFCSAELGRHIKARVAPRLDQHASCELSLRRKPTCTRKGAACDFLVDDEDMREVAEWIVANVPFDRLYFYGSDRPVHVSFGPEQSRTAYAMVLSKNQQLIPRPFGA
jgi:DNA phosphorothioation-associated putative methyltransferase